uniref:ATP synthase F0 subunit 8 n=1 Tax=Artemia urmiana TaxID=112782 RepID=UPI00226C8B79|nr:ATP synthase F0 subunit 8 [Artemia urmiana]YP_010995012.1 ATP synthase F0 subunit 8 [Artemia parthenogenetica]UZC53570.1 ATP synthase F0 subunit 8 [Artemia urmiana]WOZ14020.1 ATP synthase F0 subunit 8 [Artemia parthenogenetica]WOZ14033.1 ATP synthase F0 subunit 8 [Artemia parthenogenetica]WOZ14046.1 ATP synthase F0 subunit 8 [Artemia parthenogenetica]
MPQMMPLPWITIFFATMLLLWILMALIFFLYQPQPMSPTSTLLNQIACPNWKW